MSKPMATSGIPIALVFRRQSPRQRPRNQRLKLLRFNTSQLHDKMTDYCLPTIAKNVKGLVEISEGRLISRDVQLDANTPTQLSLF